MGLSSLLEGLVYGTRNRKEPLAVSALGNPLVNHFLPRYAPLVAEGCVWRAQETTATASVTALPTTAGLFTLGNNEPDDGKWYVVLAVYAFNAANAAALDAFGLVGCLSQLRAVTGGIDVTMAQDLAKTTIKPMSGNVQGQYNGKAILDTGVTITDDRWFPLASDSGSTAINSGTGKTLFNWIDGLIVLSPKTLFSMVSTATSASNTTTKGLIYAEVPREWLRANA